MVESDWPKRFYPSPSVKRNLSLFTLSPGLVTLTIWLWNRDPIWIVFTTAIVLLVLLNEAKIRRPVAEFYPDHVRIQQKWIPALISIPYKEITRLELIPQLRFTIVYRAGAKEKKIAIPAAYLSGFEHAMQVLSDNTALEVSHRMPTWARFLLRDGPLVPWGNPGAWKKALIVLYLPWLIYFYSGIAVSLAWNWISDFGWVEKWPPFGLALLGAIVGGIGGFLLVLSRRYVMATGALALLAVFAPLSLFVRNQLVPPFWLSLLAGASVIAFLAVILWRDSETLRG